MDGNNSTRWTNRVATYSNNKIKKKTAKEKHDTSGVIQVSGSLGSPVCLKTVTLTPLTTQRTLLRYAETPLTFSYFSDTPVIEAACTVQLTGTFKHRLMWSLQHAHTSSFGAAVDILAKNLMSAMPY